MRRVRRSRRRDEQGAIIVLMTVFMVVIVAMAALVVDVGALLDERRQLQNAADAGALAVAHSCALDASTCIGEATSLAQDLANANSRDVDSAVDAVTFDAATNQVRVDTSTRSGGKTILPSKFGQVLSGVEGTTVRATATASWGSVGRATVVPLVISLCEFNEATQNGVTFPDPAVDPRTVIYFHAGGGGKTAEPCVNQAGLDTPGGFGWVQDGDCQINVQVGQALPVNPGVSAPQNCDLKALVNQTVLIPIFDSITSTNTPPATGNSTTTSTTGNGNGGGNPGGGGGGGGGGSATGCTTTSVGAAPTPANTNQGEYHVYGFAEFHITGLRFPSTTCLPLLVCSAPDTCLEGYFTRFVSAADAAGGPNLGATSVFLVS